MTQPQKVIGFLDLFGDWNPALAFVMIGAIGVHSVLFRFITKRESPVLVDQFHLPTKSDLTPSLLVGAALFGIGWGIGGFCPGPAITSLPSGNLESAVFVGAMMLGKGLFRICKPLLDKYLP
ncbi:MAG: YeeE/YedE family protein [Bdellovibrionales bacterium]|nr:YeeE/YedE family protein [Bdellovibrionales bacterium]